MSLWSRLVERLKQSGLVAEKPTNLPTVTVGNYLVGRPIGPSDFDVRRLVDEGYRRNVVVYVCVNEIAQSVGAPKLKVRDRRSHEDIETHPLLDLFERPNPDMGLYELFERTIVHMQTAGVAFLHKGRNAAGQVIRLTNLRPERLTPIPDGTGTVVEYEYKMDGALRGQRLPRNDLIVFRLYDPLNDYHGLPPLMVCATFGDIDSEAAKYLRDFFMNGAMPMGILKFKVPNLPTDVKKAIIQEWQDTYGRLGDTGAQGRSNWHSIGAIGADAEYQSLSAEPSQLRLDAVWGMSETRICATFGVPPSIVQMRIGLQYNTYSNAEQAQKSFWIETLWPMYRRIGDGLTTQLAQEVDETVEAYWDIESLPMLQESEDQRATRAQNLYKEGVYSRNEARKLLKLPEDKSDYIVMPTGAKLKTEVEAGIKTPEPPPPGQLNPPIDVRPLPLARREPPGLPPARQPKQLPAPPPPKEGQTDDGDLERHVHHPHVVESGGKFRVVDDDGHVYGTHPTRKRADAQVAALYASKQSEGEATEYELYGVGDIPWNAEAMVQTRKGDLDRAFTAAAEAGRQAVSLSDLREALNAGDRKRAEAVVADGVEVFIERYREAFQDHLLDVALQAAAVHDDHHSTSEEDAEAQAADPARKWFRENLPKGIADELYSRYMTETRRLEAEARVVVRSEILRMLKGEVAGISPRAILEVIGLSERQKEMLDRARARLVKEDKGRVAIDKEMAAFRAKLLRERAEAIAEHETRIAEAFGQRAAWEQMIADGRINRKDWRKLWTTHPEDTASGVCAHCEPLDEVEVRLNELFSTEEGEYEGPPLHPHCACRVVLVRAEKHAKGHGGGGVRLDPRVPNIFNPAAGGRLPRKGGKRVELGPLKPGLHQPRDVRPVSTGGRPLRPQLGDRAYKGDDTAEGHWVQIQGHPVFIKGPRPGGGPAAGASLPAGVSAGPAHASDPTAVGNIESLAEMTPAEQELYTKELKSMRPNYAQGVNPSYVVTFKDGSRAMFKPASAEWIGAPRVGCESQMKREYVAWLAAKEAGFTDIVAPTVMRDFGDGKGPGALIKFWPNASNAGDSTNPWDGARDLQRMAAFDAIMGHVDRHPGNWMIQSDQIRMIDHGLMLASKLGGLPNGSFPFSRVAMKDDFMNGAHERFTKGLVEKADRLTSIFAKVGIAPRAIELFHERVAMAKTHKTWRTFYREQVKQRHTARLPPFIVSGDKELSL